MSDMDDISDTASNLHAYQMLAMAEDDVNALHGMLEAGDKGLEFFSDAIFGFHAQQAAEKSLKAWLSKLQVEYTYTHDLMRLIDLLKDSGAEVPLLKELVELNPFAVQYRYELLADEDESIDRQLLFDQINLVYLHVVNVISSN